MYNREYWQDHVLSETGKFDITPDGEPTKTCTVKPKGTVMQEGTHQDAAHFNNMEEGILANQIAATLLLNHTKQTEWNLDEIREAVRSETGTITLTNSAKFPFNNSQRTIPLATRRPNAQYVVVTEIANAKGNVGEIEVSDILANGFKLNYTGSASSVTINYKIIGGYLK